MKKAMQALLVLFVSALAFSSCKKDKDEASVVGKWGVTQTSYKYTVNGTIDEQDTENYTSSHPDYFTIELKSDGKFVVVEDGDTDEGTYRVDGNKIYFKDTGTSTEEDYDLTVTESEMTLYEKDEYTQNSVKYIDEYTTKFKRL